MAKLTGYEVARIIEAMIDAEKALDEATISPGATTNQIVSWARASGRLSFWRKLFSDASITETDIPEADFNSIASTDGGLNDSAPY